MSHPTKATPFGCVIGFIGVLCLLIATFAAWAWWKAGAIEDPEKLAAARGELAQYGIVSAIAGVLIIMIGYRLAMRADMSSPYDPDRPTMR